MKKISVLLSIFFGLLGLVACSHSAVVQEKSPVRLAAHERLRADHEEAVGHEYAVATQGEYATQAAQTVLGQGGNLIDAAIATSFVLAVERPQSTGLTGGGFFLYREGASGKVFAIDFRERAPLQATKNMFLDNKGKPDKNLSEDSILSSGVPGLVAGLSEIHQRFGHLSWAQVIQPAVDLAEKGFPVYPELAEALLDRSTVLLRHPAAKKIFTKADGKVLQSGDLLVQKDLAQTLKLISVKGRWGFYSGPVAKKFLAYFKSQKGLITAKDFAAYQVKWREPLRGTFHGYEIVSMPPPSSGGVHVLQFLNFLENDHLADKGFLSTEAIHLAASGFQSAFADRAQYLGDPDFVQIPVKGLISKAYARERRQEISMKQARHLYSVQAGNPLPYESNETTHFSMIDKGGNMISSTQTINGWMGSGLVVPGTGLVLNNEMDDFSALEGGSNMYGAIGGKNNSIQPQKTPLSSMSPTLVLKGGKPVLAVGAPGGTRIISCVAQTILNFLEFHLSLFDSIASVRYHHQWQPDVLQIEPPGPAPQVLEELKKMTYNIELEPLGCYVMAVSVSSEKDPLFDAVADPRDIGMSYAQ